MILNTFKKAFINAWNMLIELPLPFKHDESDTAETESTILLTQAFFPVVGLICALLAMLLGAVLNKFLYQIPAAAIFAAVLTFTCIFKDSGRGLAGLMALTSLKQDETSFEERLYNLPDSITEVDTPTATLTMILVVLFKLFAFSLMAFYGYVYWLAAVCVLEFTIEGDLATLPSFRKEQSLLKIKKSKQRYIWFIAGFLVLFVLFKAPVSSLILFGTAFAISYGLRIYCREKLDGIDSKIIGLAAYIFELFALSLGVVFLTKG